MDFEQISELCTGHTVSPESYQRTKERRADISAASRMMVERMRRLGVDLITPTMPDAVAIGNLTGEVAEAWPDQDIVRKTVVPSHAATVRSKWLREAEYYLRKHPNGKNARFGVVSTGVRIYFDPENPEAFDKECRKQLKRGRTAMRRWRHESAGFGVEFVMTVLEAAVDGNSVHLHFNVIYIPCRMTAERWERWLRWSSKRLGAWWKDCGRIRDLREVIKYATKLLGPDSLESLNDSQFGQLFNLLDGMTTILAHDKFADWRRQLDAEGKKVIRLPINGGLVIFDKRKREPRNEDEDERTPGNEQELIENRILTRQVPRPFSSEVIEPVTIVQHYTENPVTLAGKRGLALIKAQIEQAQVWGEANGYIVHTIQPSVQVCDTGGEPNLEGGGLQSPPPYGCRSDSYGVQPVTNNKSAIGNIAPIPPIRPVPTVPTPRSQPKRPPIKHRQPVTATATNPRAPLRPILIKDKRTGMPTSRSERLLARWNQASTMPPVTPITRTQQRR